MGTRSAIGYKTPEGKVRAKYCHYDGYVAHNGRILQEHYQAAYKIAQLVELGDMSTLDAEIGVQVDFDDRAAQEGQCVFYGRDRGESGTHAQEFDTVQEFVDYYTDSGCEYFYLHTAAGWIVHDRYNVGKDSFGYPVFDDLETRVTLEVARLKAQGYDI